MDTQATPSTTTGSGVLCGISSMATRALLAQLIAGFEAQSPWRVQMESVGGVDAAKRVLGGEAFDLVVLASDALDKLLAAGRLLPGSKVDLVRSAVAVAVRQGAPHPDIGSEAAVRAAVLAAPSLAWSTGPSGVALAALFARWGIAEQVQARMVQAPPGVPVGGLVARGEAALGFQQRSELLGLEGIAVLGDLPEPIAIITTFSAGIGVACAQTAAVQALLAYMNAPQADAAKWAQGMAPVHQPQNHQETP